jgi:DNA invertase Pin-like site-specific DNA recombinase
VRDRVGREMFRTSVAFLDLVEAGVKVYLHSDGGQELKLDTPLGKVMLGLRRYAAEEYRHPVRVKTRDRLRAKVAAGHVATCGGVVYGFRNVRRADRV